ncbi:MaoC like domain-containing protein [Mycena pura]|uniref:MaoC like domain-containing protein n=1 Tax=Mycena pura TaxID=153505 RepID=A0AAD7E5U1_9AGAR|nr:MaoC like domain-containing protein [Mycena pura]
MDGFTRGSAPCVWNELRTAGQRNRQMLVPYKFPLCRSSPFFSNTSFEDSLWAAEDIEAVFDHCRTGVVEERFAGINGGGHKPSLHQLYTSLDDPLPFVESFFKEYPIASKQLLASEDSADFLAISQCPGQKLVPFIPVLHLSRFGSRRTRFGQKTSRWSLTRTPSVSVSCKGLWLKVEDEPIKDLLGNINSELIPCLLELKYSGDGSKRPEANGDTVFEFGSTLPEASTWLDTLAGPDFSWLRALVTSKTIVQGTPKPSSKARPTSIIRLLTPSSGQKAVVAHDGNLPVWVSIYGAARSYGEHKPMFQAVYIKFAPVMKLRRIYFRGPSGRFCSAVQSFASIHEIATGRNTRIKEESIGSFGTAMTLNSRGHHQLVHLSNGFRTVEGAKPLQVGDVLNTDAGKVVKVKAHVLRAGKPVIAVISAYLYRRRFTDYENTFETLEEPDYIVKLAVGVLQSKEWFKWIDESKPLLAGTSLIFRIKSRVAFKDKTLYRNVSVTGDIFVRNQLKALVLVGLVDLHQDDCLENPVVAYIQRHGSHQGLATPLANDGYTLSSGAITSNAHFTNEPYSAISGDFNPIHINPYFSDYASLPATITHGLRSSAVTHRSVETVAAKGMMFPFVGMVLPGDELLVKIRHIGMRDGNIVVNAVISNSRAEKVLEGSAEVLQPTTIYVSTGQGSQERGMGMDLYNSSPSAHASADAHLLAVYGFSIVEIIRRRRLSILVKSRVKRFVDVIWTGPTIWTRTVTSRLYPSLPISIFDSEIPFQSSARSFVCNTICAN